MTSPFVSAPLCGKTNSVFAPPFEDAHDICFNYLGWGGIRRWADFGSFCGDGRESYALLNALGPLSVSLITLLFFLKTVSLDKLFLGLNLDIDWPRIFCI
jgi:hypothetical protein